MNKSKYNNETKNNSFAQIGWLKDEAGKNVSNFEPQVLRVKETINEQI